MNENNMHFSAGSRSWDKGGGPVIQTLRQGGTRSPKKFFRPLGPQFGPKINKKISRIPDSTSKNFPDSGIQIICQIPSYGANEFHLINWSIACSQTLYFLFRDRVCENCEGFIDRKRTIKLSGKKKERKTSVDRLLMCVNACVSAKYPKCDKNGKNNESGKNIHFRFRIRNLLTRDLSQKVVFQIHASTCLKQNKSGPNCIRHATNPKNCPQLWTWAKGQRVLLAVIMFLYLGWCCML